MRVLLDTHIFLWLVSGDAWRKRFALAGSRRSARFSPEYTLRVMVSENGSRQGRQGAKSAK